MKHVLHPPAHFHFQLTFTQQVKVMFHIHHLTFTILFLNVSSIFSYEDEWETIEWETEEENGEKFLRDVLLQQLLNTPPNPNPGSFLFVVSKVWSNS